MVMVSKKPAFSLLAFKSSTARGTFKYQSRFFCPRRLFSPIPKFANYMQRMLFPKIEAALLLLRFS